MADECVPLLLPEASESTDYRAPCNEAIDLETSSVWKSDESSNIYFLDELSLTTEFFNGF